MQQWNATADVGTDEAGLTTLTDEAGLTTLTDEAGGAAASTVPHVVVIAAASGPDSSWCSSERSRQYSSQCNSQSLQHLVHFSVRQLVQQPVQHHS